MLHGKCKRAQLTTKLWYSQIQFDDFFENQDKNRVKDMTVLGT
jgi:hypothetical protein